MSDSTDNEEGLELLEGGGNRSKLPFLPFGPRTSLAQESVENF